MPAFQLPFEIWGACAIVNVAFCYWLRATYRNPKYWGHRRIREQIRASDPRFEYILIDRPQVLFSTAILFGPVLLLAMLLPGD